MSESPFGECVVECLLDIYISCLSQEALVASCLMELRTSPSIGQATTSSQLCRPKLLACHSGAAFGGGEPRLLSGQLSTNPRWKRLSTSLGATSATTRSVLLALHPSRPSSLIHRRHFQRSKAAFAACLGEKASQIQVALSTEQKSGDWHEVKPTTAEGATL